MGTTSSITRAGQNDDQRYSQFVEQEKNEHQAKIRELEVKHAEEISSLADRYKKEKTEMEKTFNVSISEESKRQAERLDSLHQSNQAEYETEKKRADTV